MKIQDFTKHGLDYFLPNLSIDIVIMGYKEQELKCLLLKMGDKWMLPGGHIGIDESVNKSVERILLQRTNLINAHLKFLSLFGDKDRIFKQEFMQFFKKNGIPWRDDYWINNRFITLAYYSLVDIDQTFPVAGDMDEAVEWFSLDDLPVMWLDHRSIITTARNQLKRDIKNELITYNLLPAHFTMPQLHQLHETILQEKIDRSRFQKQILATKNFERMPQLKNDSPGRNPYLYKLKV